MIRLRLFRPVLTLVLVAVLGNGFPPAAGRGSALPLRSTLPDGIGAPVAPFTPPRMTR